MHVHCQTMRRWSKIENMLHVYIGWNWAREIAPFNEKHARWRHMTFKAVHGYHILHRFEVIGDYCSNFGRKTATLRLRAPPWQLKGNVRYTVHLRLIGKPVVGFLFVLIELFLCYSWGARSENRSRHFWRNGFHCFPSVTECFSFRCCRKLRSCQKTFKLVNGKTIAFYSLWGTPSH